MRLAQFITANTTQLISEWEHFARIHVAGARKMDLVQRRDHVAGMLAAIAADLDTPQTPREQASKATGEDDSSLGSRTAANAHGTDRAATGFEPIELVSEFRSLRASVLRLWAEAQTQWTREDLDDVTRFNESIDQQLAESLARYTHDIDRARDLFLGVLSHDLRNPLGAIMMSAAVIMTAEGQNSPQHRTAARILNAGTRMDRLIGDLVDFTRNRLGSGIPIVRAEMDLGTLCRQTVDEITAFHPRRVVNFEASGDLHGRWDSGRLGQAVSNLCGNAAQHGSANAPIDVAARGEAERVVVTVHNAGSPIPPDRLEDIFDPFKQLEPGSTRPHDARSIGLGLYIVKAIVTAHDGTIDVESNERGTTFTVSLPRAPGDESAATLPQLAVH